MTRYLILSLLVVGSAAFAQVGSGGAPVRSGELSWFVGAETGGDIHSWEGGDLRAPIIEEGSKRRPGAAARADARIEVAANLSPAAREWLQGALQGQRTARDIHMVELKPDMTVLRVMSYQASKITEIQFPALVASSESVRACITLKFSPTSATESTQAPAVSGGSGTAKGRVIHSNEFSLSIDGIQPQGITEVSSITARIGSDGTPRISSILVTVVGVDLAQAGWKTWFDSYVVEGKNSDSDEKSGTLVLYNLSGPALSIGLKGLGIVRMSRGRVEDASNKSVPYRHEIELTCEALTLDEAKAGLAPVPVKPLNPGPGAGEDQGARDPAGVPRFTECVRTGFTGVRLKTQGEEGATYVTRASIEEVDAFLSEKMKELKWTEVSRTETGRLADLSYKLDVRWEREKQTSILILRKLKDGSTTIEWLVRTPI